MHHPPPGRGHPQLGDPFSLPWACSRIAKGPPRVLCVGFLKRQIANQRETIFHFIFNSVHSLLFPRGFIFSSIGFSHTKSSMTDGNEIINVFVFEGDVPTLPP